MATTLLKVIADLNLSLAAAVSVGATTATLQSANDGDGVAIPAGLYGFTIDGDNSAKEFFTCDLSGTTLTNVQHISAQGVATVGFANYHRVGAVVTITDWAIFSRILNNLTGTTGFDAGAALKYDGQPLLSDLTAIPTVQFVTDLVNGGTVSVNATVIAGDAGETIVSGDWVYYDTTTGKWLKTNATDTAKCFNVRVGKARGAGTNNNAIVGGIFVDGLETVTTYVAGTTYYIGNTAGALSTSAGTNSVVVGVGDNNGALVLRRPTANQTDAMLGNAGTPSSINRFVTETGLLTTESFGSGADGTVTMDGTNTYATFATKSGNIYTLTRDVQAQNFTIGAGVTLNTDGWVIYVRDTITGTGTIRHSDPATGVGGAGGATTKAGGGSGAGGGIVVIMAAIWAGTFTIQSIGSDGGAGGSAGTGSGSAGTAGTARGSGPFVGPAGQTGAAGTTVGTSGTAGTAGATVTNSLAVNNGAAGGKGGGTNSDGIGNQAGGAGGSYTSPTVGITLYKFLATSLLGIDSTGLLKKLSTLPGSGSGASGGWDSSPNEQAGGGGGGGGNGGLCVFVYKSKTWTGTSAFTGGTGGAAGSGGTNTPPGSGVNGNTGSLIQLNWLQLI